MSNVNKQKIYVHEFQDSNFPRINISNAFFELHKYQQQGLHLIPAGQQLSEQDHLVLSISRGLYLKLM